MITSSVQRIQQHLNTEGADVSVPEELHEDLRSVVRNCDEVRSLGDVYQSVELSPYMQSLLRVSNLEASPRMRHTPASTHSMAAGL